MNALTPEEARVIVHKGTEAPFSGEYWNTFEPGIFVCRQCGLPLFDAKAKFEADCGWPSFDATFPLAVKELLDADGERTEIQCARCGGHLGHVFRGEQYTEKNTRHCANSLSIKFIPQNDQQNYLDDAKNQLNLQEIILGGGCFWCIEAAMLRMPGVVQAVSGYSGGAVQNPSYQQVCTGETGHAEVVKIIFDSNVISLQEILSLFFKIHDATTLNRQGNDVGTQYRSIIFYSTATEKSEIETFIAKEQENYSGKIITEIVAIMPFYQAEEYHQRYFEKNPYAGYCQAIVRPKVDKVLDLIEPKA